MFHLSEEFQAWLDQDPNRKKDLPQWEELLKKHLEQNQQTFNQQLKELNVLIDSRVEHYTEPIEFEGFKDYLRENLAKLQTAKEKLAQENNLAQSKISDLENSLQEKETNWKDKEKSWNKDLRQKEQTIITLNRNCEKLTTEKKNQEQKLITNIQELEQTAEKLTAELQQYQQKITDLEQQLTIQTQTKNQLQSLYEIRKQQVLVIGIMSLVLIIYLAWPKQEKIKEEPKTWSYV